jgi:hypothetical protein
MTKKTFTLVLPALHQLLSGEGGSHRPKEGHRDGVEKHEPGNEKTEEEIFSGPDVGKSGDEGTGCPTTGGAVEHLTCDKRC